MAGDNSFIYTLLIVLLLFGGLWYIVNSGLLQFTNIFNTNLGDDFHSQLLENPDVDDSCSFSWSRRVYDCPNEVEAEVDCEPGLECVFAFRNHLGDDTWYWYTGDNPLLDRSVVLDDDGVWVDANYIDFSFDLSIFSVCGESEMAVWSALSEGRYNDLKFTNVDRAEMDCGGASTTTSTTIPLDDYTCGVTEYCQSGSCPPAYDCVAYAPLSGEECVCVDGDGDVHPDWGGGSISWCYDSDDGKVTGTAGYCEDWSSSEIHEDSCGMIDRVTEWYCSEDDLCVSTLMECPDYWLCSSGRCKYR